MSNRESKRRPQPRQHETTSNAGGARRNPTVVLAWGGVAVALVALAFTFGLIFGGFGGIAANQPESASADERVVSSERALPSASAEAGATDPPVRDLPARWDRGTVRSGPVPVRVDPEHVDFGIVSPNEIHPVRATLTNTGEDTLRIITSRADCGCTTVDMAGKSILPGDSLQLDATFDSQSREGTRRSVITVVFEGYSDPVRVPITAFIE